MKRILLCCVAPVLASAACSAADAAEFRCDYIASVAARIDIIEDNCSGKETRNMINFRNRIIELVRSNTFCGGTVKFGTTIVEERSSYDAASVCLSISDIDKAAARIMATSQ